MTDRLRRRLLDRNLGLGRVRLDLRVVHFQATFLDGGLAYNIIIGRWILTCSDVENDEIIPKKSSGFLASAASVCSP